MNKKVDPEEFGLPGKTIIEQIHDLHLVIVLMRKSRIIMSDGIKIVDKVKKIKKRLPDVKISLKIAGPICSKTRTFLKTYNIDIR